MFFQEVVKDERYEKKIQLCDNIIEGGHINSAKLQEGTESEIHICCVVGYNKSSTASLSEEKGEGTASPCTASMWNGLIQYKECSWLQAMLFMNAYQLIVYWPVNLGPV